MSSRGRQGGGGGRRVGLEGVEDGPGEASLEAADGFGAGVTGGKAFGVVGLGGFMAAQLGDRDPVQGGVQRAVADAADPDLALGASGPYRYRGDAGVHGV